MRYDQFLNQVKERTGITSDERTAAIVQGVLETFGERLEKTERDNLRAQLPRELKDLLTRRPPADRFSLEEFYNRVKARADVGYPDAVAYSKTVMEVLNEAVSEGEINDILISLPDSFRELFGIQPPGPLSPGS